jgi:hypothetical protein
MKVTREFIMDNRTLRGAWTRLQIQALGIVWPPRQGWIEDVIGRDLTEDQVHQFVNSTTPMKRKGDPHLPGAHAPRQGFVAIQNPAAATNAELLECMALLLAELGRRVTSESPPPEAAQVQVKQLTLPEIDHGAQDDSSPPWD